MAESKEPRKLVDLTEEDLASLVDERIAKAIGIAPKEVEGLEADLGVMTTPSVLSTVRATAAAMC